MNYLRRLKRLPRPLLLAGGGLLIVLIGINIGSNFIWHRQPQPRSAATQDVSQSSIPTSAAVSPLLFGSNLDFSSDQGQALTSPTLRTLLQQIHVQILRIPAYSDSSQATVKSMAQVIRSIGVTPLIVLHGSLDPHALDIDTSLVQTMNNIFSSVTVYYEFGNEDDALGASAEHYASAWNSIIPQLKLLAPQAKFLGPANYQYSRDFLMTFLQQAKPQPDAISWHEYSCASSWSKELCLSHISDWTQHIADARLTTQAILKSALPIMITEWNYAADATASDNKSNDQSFLASWTTRAIQTLAASHIFAAMQYTCTNSATPLIDKDHLTPQGLVFQQQYDQLITQAQRSQPTSPAIAATSTARSQSNTTIKFSFEDGGTDGFGKSNTMTDLQNSTDFAWDGQSSLKITISNSAYNDYPTLWFDGPPSTDNPHTGQTFFAYVYVPLGSIPPVASAYVEDSNHKQCDACHSPGWRDWVTLIPGKWTRVAYTVDSGVSMPTAGFGISLTTRTSKPVNTTVYIDAVGWA